MTRHVEIAPTAIIAPQASLNIFSPPPANGQAFVSIGEDSHIFCAFNLLRPEARIRIGARSQIGNVNFVCAREITVGDDVLMAWGITVLDSNHHAIQWEDRKFDVPRCREDYLAGLPLGFSHDWEPVEKHPVRIGNKCWIGCNAIILKGVTIHEGAIIGAGSVVTKDVEPWSIVAGNPARYSKRGTAIPSK